MKAFTIDRDACLRDGLCLPSCPRYLLVSDVDGIPALPEDNERLCTRCGHCAAVCPAGAIHIHAAEGEKIKPIREENKVTPAQVDQLLQSCRSVRRFTDRPVARQEISDILQTARLAPSGGNNQMVRWVILSDRTAVKKASDYAVEWFDTVARSNPRHAARYAIDSIVNRYRDGEDTILRGAPNAVLAYSDNKATWGPEDSAIALTYFNLAAHVRGIGSCWGGYLIRATMEYAPLREYLGIPEGCTVHGAMVFGYPDITYHAVPVRSPLQVLWV